MGTLERTVTLDHPLGEAGEISLKNVTGLIRIRAGSGTTAHVTVTYRVRASDQAAAERALEDGQVQIERGEGRLSIETAERRLSTGLSWLFGGGSRVKADMDVEVPAGTRVRAETVSGEIEASGLIGDQQYRSVSGDVDLGGVSGRIDANTVSGTLRLDGQSVAVRAVSISGGVRARAASFSDVHVSTTSGTVSLVGVLAPDGEYRVDSVSGDLEVATPSGLLVEAKSISGSIRSQVPHRLDGGRGNWRAVTGNGESRVRFNSVSGQVRVLRPPASIDPVGADPAAAQPEPILAADPAGVSSGGWTERDPAAAPAAADAVHGDDEMAVLEALERGEIGVEEAARRLESGRRREQEVSSRAG